MKVQQATAPELAGQFTEAMSRLVSGVAVVSARRADGRPCGLLVSSICSYSVRPPSVLLALSRSSRTGRELGPGRAFGVHLLGHTDAGLAEVFAGSGEDKFAAPPWEWDGAVPRLLGVPVYLRCVARRVFEHGDHAILVGEAADCVLDDGEPLIYFRRRLNWRIAGEGYDSDG
ncbi:flavin reductase family protein [Kitasatospora sp. NBC_01266]|uniref:flavin reductase family protein n=1 Tax=Kitasatospora sp. NBC_01266 TaxID=2903572 RepID=UPI002E33FF18|nr:flavin reductase family protein [Kitasatospora sp. NBC_01266]